MGPIRYVETDGVHLAYRVVGDGGSDIVWVPGWFSDIDESLNVPGLAAFLEELAGLGRLIMFDKRGMGQSDRVQEGHYPSLEERVGDLLAVMDAAGSERAALVGVSEGAAQSLLAAARHPDRVTSVVSIGGWARLLAPAGDPGIGLPRASLDEFTATAREHWGTGRGVGVVAPSVAHDPLFRERWATYERRAASPGAFEAYSEMLGDVDVRDALDDVTVPVLLIHSQGDRMVSVDQSRYMADRLPDARLVEIASSDHITYISDPELVLEEIEQHLTGRSDRSTGPRRFAAVLFVDIVGSTGRVSDAGDRSWTSLLRSFEAIVDKEVTGHAGQVVKSLGDGSLAVFDDPQAAVLTARALHREVARLGVELRSGVHCGQVEVLGDDIGGIAVHIASRVMDAAPPRGTFVSSTVRDVLLGSGLVFAPAGTHVLKGVPGEWTLFELSTDRARIRSGNERNGQP
ncbi:MAG: adenylate/guanylate cyclase domain-containing protein [Actinobacteria bacterium]|nr:adenylate/guanylate cyclase domain-containing protein [Actinomycetota bacterium]